MKRCEITNPYPASITVTEVPLPACPEKGAVVRILYSGVCHSDLHIWDGFLTVGQSKVLNLVERPGFSYPKIPGHEIVGVVEFLGSRAVGCGVSVGDRVVVYTWGGCGDCRRCLNGLGNLCEESKKEIGFDIPGGYAQFVAVDLVSYLIPLPEHIDGATGCMLGCAGLTSYSAVKKAMPVVTVTADLGETPKLMVIGAGGVALWGLQLARTCFPKSTIIICAEVDDEKFSAAKKAGADKTVLFQLDKDIAMNAEAVTVTSNGKVDAVLDFVNSSFTAAVAVECIRKGGMCVMIGLFGGSLELCLPFMPLCSRTVTAVYTGSLPDLRELVQLVSNKGIHAPTHEFHRLDELQDVFEKMKKGQLNGRAILKPN
ncbi:alcohol dehydrogenase-like [Corticium candelabrum]|uniref:alcohol dehydrogenase-like n=1 Tax=Corticium candelabrum TaxID=121492 RepID=UPI002E263589|nr:alcohol dehydrogenase-like [Corticium candelabrum]